MYTVTHHRRASGNRVTVPLVQAGLLNPLFSFACENGLPGDVLRKRVRLPGNVVDEPTHFVPAPRWFDLFRQIVEQSGLPDVGWQAAWDQPLAGYSRDFTRGIASAPTLLEALRFITRVQVQHCNCQSLTVRVIGNFAYFFHYDTCRHPGYEQRNGFRTASLIRVLQSFLGDDWQPDLLITDTPLEVLPTRTILESVQVVQRRGYSAVRIPRASLAARCDHVFDGGYTREEVAASDSIDQIKQLLRSYARGDMPSLQELAEMAHVSTRSLQRRLGEAHTSYSQLAREGIFEVARQMLRDPTLTITDVTYELGFRDASNFSRFYRGISGESPSEFRHRSAQGTYSH